MEINIGINQENLKKLLSNFSKMPDEIRKTIKGASAQYFLSEVMPTEGLQKYPAIQKQRTKYPYYVRGRGTQYSENYNNGKSERLGTQFRLRWEPETFKTYIGNRASYAPYVVGEEQSKRMEGFGWLRLIDVVRDTLPKAIVIYDKWIAATLQRLGL